VKRVLCDTGFYHIDFIEKLVYRGYSYIISAPLYEILQREIITLCEWKKIDKSIKVNEFYFQHLDAKWKRTRRYVVVRQEIYICPKAFGKQPGLFKELEELKSYRYSLFITNGEENAAEVIWREYRPRANDENKVKDLKAGYGFVKLNLKNFWATEAVMSMIALMYHHLIHYL